VKALRKFWNSEWKISIFKENCWILNWKPFFSFPRDIKIMNLPKAFNNFQKAHMTFLSPKKLLFWIFHLFIQPYQIFGSICFYLSLFSTWFRSQPVARVFVYIFFVHFHTHLQNFFHSTMFPRNITSRRWDENLVGIELSGEKDLKKRYG
jgi:hypothetical protein